MDYATDMNHPNDYERGLNDGMQFNKNELERMKLEFKRLDHRYAIVVSVISQMTQLVDQTRGWFDRLDEIVSEPKQHQAD